jgi:MFS family permease
MTVAWFCFGVLVVAYCDRVNLSTAVPSIMSQYHWDSIQMGWVLSGFFLGYTCCLIPAGLLVQKYGPWRVLAFCITGWSITTLLTPFAKSAAEMYAMRVLLGLCESGVFPSINSLLAEWFPPKEFARAAGFCWSGGYAGSILAFPAAGLLLRAWGWHAPFYGFGLLALLLLIPWIRIYARDRNTTNLPAVVPSAAVPQGQWKLLLVSPAVWALLALHFSSNWFAYVLLSWLPAFLQQDRHLSVASTAFGSALPFVAAFLGTSIFGILIDKLSARYARTKVCKTLLGLYMLSGLALLTLPLARNTIAVLAVLSASSFLMTSATPVYASGSLNLVPGLTAVLVGLQVSFANLAGVLAPPASGYLIRFASWNAVFALTAAFCVLGAAIYVLIGRAEPLAALDSALSAAKYHSISNSTIRSSTNHSQLKPADQENA